MYTFFLGGSGWDWHSHCKVSSPVCCVFGSRVLLVFWSPCMCGVPLSHILHILYVYIHWIYYVYIYMYVFTVGSWSWPHLTLSLGRRKSFDIEFGLAELEFVCAGNRLPWNGGFDHSASSALAFQYFSPPVPGLEVNGLMLRQGGCQPDVQDFFYIK